MGNLEQFEANHGPLVGTAYAGILAVSKAGAIGEHELPTGFHEVDLAAGAFDVAAESSSMFPLQ